MPRARRWSMSLFAMALTTAACSERPIASIKITGSDTMVNLVQAWAEAYTRTRQDVSVQVVGGGSGVGLACLIEDTTDIAAASREIKPSEIARSRARHGVPPIEFRTALDALAIYVHKANPLDQIAVRHLADIYGEGGVIERWSQLGIHNGACASDAIIRVGRQNNSGTYVHFRDVVLGPAREFKMGSIDQSGSKDVVGLVSRTPCAIGYSGMAYAIPAVKTLRVSTDYQRDAVGPGVQAVLDGAYPLARPLYLDTSHEPVGAVKAFIDWTLGPEGQQVVRDIGFVPAVREGVVP